MTSLARATSKRLVRSCHDLSEGGLAVAAAEMAFAGSLGMKLSLSAVPQCALPYGESMHLKYEYLDEKGLHRLAAMPRANSVLLFSESNTRFLVEVAPESTAAFEAALAGNPIARVGTVTADQALVIAREADNVLVNSDIGALKTAWQKTLDF